MRRQRYKWPKTLHKDLEANGLIETFTSRYKYDKAYQFYELDSLFMAWEEVTAMVLDPMGDETGTAARNMIAEAYEEKSRGASWDADHLVVLGRKPLTESSTSG